MLLIFLNHLRQGQLLTQLLVYPFNSIRRKKGLWGGNTRAKEWQCPYQNQRTLSLRWWDTRLQITVRLLPLKLEHAFWERFHNCMSLFFWSWWTRLFSRERICHQNIDVGLISPDISVKFQITLSQHWHDSQGGETRSSLYLSQGPLESHQPKTFYSVIIRKVITNFYVSAPLSVPVPTWARLSHSILNFPSCFLSLENYFTSGFGTKSKEEPLEGIK